MSLVPNWASTMAKAFFFLVTDPSAASTLIVDSDSQVYLEGFSETDYSSTAPDMMVAVDLYSWYLCYDWVGPAGGSWRQSVGFSITNVQPDNPTCRSVVVRQEMV